MADVKKIELGPTANRKANPLSSLLFHTKADGKR